VRTFCTVSRRPRGAARAANSARSPLLPLALPQRRRRRRSAGAKEKSIDAGRGSTPGDQGHVGFDKGTLAAAPIGLMRAGQKAARSRASVRAAAPCKIRRSVCLGPWVAAQARYLSGHPRRFTVKSSLTVNGLECWGMINCAVDRMECRCRRHCSHLLAH
jgi:hypothetical protein